MASFTAIARCAEDRRCQVNAPGKNQALKCSQVVRAIPLERFRLPTDGRKWKQVARSRKAFLLHLSSYANSDGTFVRNGRNYSPSLKTLLKDFSRGSYTRLTDDLHAFGFLDWTREKHYDRRIYEIHLPEAAPTPTPNQYPDSQESVSTFTQGSVPTFDGKTSNQYPHSPNQYPDSQITVSTSVHHPSLPSLPSRERESRLPNNNQTALPPLVQNQSKPGGAGQSSTGMRCRKRVSK